MPLREYHCAKCQTEFEELVFGDTPPPCPTCGAQDVRSLISRCCVLGGGDDFNLSSGSGSSSGSCSGCAGGNCASCH